MSAPKAHYDTEGKHAKEAAKPQRQQNGSKWCSVCRTAGSSLKVRLAGIVQPLCQQVTTLTTAGGSRRAAKAKEKERTGARAPSGMPRETANTEMVYPCPAA